jgi:hypothetical protein
MRIPILVSGLVLLLVANVIMMYYKPFGLIYGERFQNMDVSGVAVTATPAAMPTPTPAPATPASTVTAVQDEKKKEGFTSYSLANGGGAKDKYEPIGPFDGVKLSTGNSSSWRYTAPNEPLMGPEFAPGPDSLFIFKNNQCKPECCGASFACDGGCVCTTPQQRDYINQRGGNRTLPDDSV